MSEAEVKVTTEEMAKVQINNNDEGTKPATDSRPKKDKPLGVGPVRRVERNKSGPNGMRTGPSRRAPPGRSKSHKIGRPVFWPVGIATDVNILVLPGHRNHFLHPGNADMNTD